MNRTAENNLPRHLLALDTAGGVIAACVIRDGRCCELKESPSGGQTRSTTIVPQLQGLLEQAGLAWDQLDMLALGAGPGAFTGLRIGAATLAGINAGLQLPILHLSSLAITAMQTASDEPVRVLEDARAGEMFCGYYRGGVALEPDRSLSWNDVDALMPGAYCCHADAPRPLLGWQRLPLVCTRSHALAQIVREALAGGIDVLALPCYPEPRYLQRSQAERNMDGSMDAS